MQTIMYIGRDGSFAEEDGSYDYYESRKAMDKQGWHQDKTIEANQMAEKVPLAEYLFDGCKKIGLVI